MYMLLLKKHKFKQYLKICGKMLKEICFVLQQGPFLKIDWVLINIFSSVKEIFTNKTKGRHTHNIRMYDIGCFTCVCTIHII